MRGIPFTKIYWIRRAFEESAMRYKQKREIVLLPHNELAETSFLILVFTEINQRAKSDYVTKFVGIKITIAFK